MTAQPIGRDSHRPWQPDPVRQRLADHTLEDVLNLPPELPIAEITP